MKYSKIQDRPQRVLRKYTSLSLGEIAEKEFGFIAKTKFEDGLKKTIDWYKKLVFSNSR